MKKCKAFYPIAGSRTAWIPCVRKAEAESGFCRRHGEAIFGAMLGAIVYEKAVDEVVEIEAEKWPRKEKKITRKHRGRGDSQSEEEPRTQAHTPCLGHPAA